MGFDIERVKRRAEEDFEQAWLDSKDMIKKKGKLLSLRKKGSSHPLFDLIQEIRQLLIELGFREVVVPTLIEKSEIFKQYGPQAPVILDRIFFLAALERPDIGISNEKISKIKKIVKGFDSVDGLQSVFRRYKTGKIEADDLSEVLMDELGVEEGQATAILSLFEEFQELEPVPTNMTLRSHTTAGWFFVLQEVQQREDLPIQLFTVGSKYRREQKLDRTHLCKSWTASLVVMTEKMSLEDGKRLTEKIMKELGFEEVDFNIKRATSKYYAPQTEFEVYVKHPETGEMIEVGDAGFYSPVTLARYGISNQVFNLGIGLERILMIREGEVDIRALVYPYQYRELEFSDNEVARTLEFEKEPKTNIGKKIAERIKKTAEDHKDEPSPCKFSAFKGKINDSEVLVQIVEPEKDTKLIGPAGFNEIYIYDGNVIGVPPEGWKEDEFLKKVREKGISTGITYMDAFAAQVASEIEEAVQKGKGEVKVRVPIARSLNDINLKLGKSARRYITNNKKRIDVRGPVFATAIVKID
ncbi:hypothetical protein AKJ45_00705 [candidate division MSBL1 archaeon SCGC-AAA261F19]|uniref:Aminoacyl-transfer RNA synthetases class-II family profile domain-containing protein n=1 Tax=candidate division MSBL1 archaeon SCGC-AAA261F19 TaxID=1698275 RepID=A0A133VBG6_9EURY|nr:hypothetical protein AKJ45_00705 [candidate division MSBL1 archaeon SCGC-AAA261F19]